VLIRLRGKFPGRELELELVMELELMMMVMVMVMVMARPGRRSADIRPASARHPPGYQQPLRNLGVGADPGDVREIRTVPP